MSRTQFFIVAISLAAASLAAPTILAAQATRARAPSPPCTRSEPYHIVDHWKIGGDGGWDYPVADPGAHRLYIAHGTEVDVVDTNTGKSIGTIPNLHGIHSIALDTAGKFGYITDGGANAVVAFDRSTLAIIATIPAGTGPDDMLFEPVTQTVWAFNGRSHDISVIDPKSNSVIATIPLPGKPEFPVTDGQGTVFDNIEDKSEIVRIDARIQNHHRNLARRLRFTLRPRLRRRRAITSSPPATARKPPSSTPPPASSSPTPPSATALTPPASATPTRSSSSPAATASSPSSTPPLPAIPPSRASPRRPARAP